MKEWTIMVYMAGDNNLSDDMIRAINDLRTRIKTVGNKIADTSAPYERNGISVLVEFDGEHPAMPSRRYDLTFDIKNPTAYSNSSKPTAVPDPPLPSAGRPGGLPANEIEDRIGSFIEHCLKTQPAKKYALVLSGHTDAFMGKTLLLDQDPSGIATVQGLREAIADKFKAHGKLDILAFDGCVMNSLEVMYEFRNVVRHWVGSQGSIPNYTWDYGYIAEHLMDFDLQSLGDKKVVESIIESVLEYNCPYAFGGRSVDISALDLSKIESFSKLLASQAQALALLLFWFGPDSAITSKILEVILLARWNCQTAMHNQSADILDLLSRLRIECAKAIRALRKDEPITPVDKVDETVLTDEQLTKMLTTAEVANPILAAVLALIHYGCSRLIAEVDGLVTKGVFVGATYRFCNGVSIFFPWSFVGLWMSRREYKKLEFINGIEGWYLFLMVHTRLSARPKMSLTKLDELNQRVKALLEFLHTQQQMLLAAADQLPFETKLTLEVVDKLAIEFADTKDSPPFNRGLESYLHHFRKTDNINPTLNIHGDFPPRREVGECVDPVDC